jgi:hypothetical protein
LSARVTGSLRKSARDALRCDGFIRLDALLRYQGVSTVR